MATNSKKVLLTLALALPSVGCVTRGQDFSSNLSWIKKGQTTQSDVSSVLGEPYKVGNSAGTPTWTYGFYHFSLFGEDQTKELKFYWTPDKKVDSFSFTSSFPADRRQQMYSK